MIALSLNNIAAIKHYQAIEVRLKERITKIVHKGISIDGHKVQPCGEFRDLLKSLLVGDRLENLITASPNQLKSIIFWVRRKFPDIFQDGTEAYHVIYNIFISSVYEKTEWFDKLNFITQIGLDCCPYCNRSYIFHLDKKQKIKPQIDHFYPKSKYPIIGISYYNLIPSCELCNGLSVKTELDPLKERLINPYSLKSDDFLFSYNLLKSSVVSPLLDRTSIQVKLAAKHRGHLTVFKLDSLYEKHADHVLELVVKSKIKYSKKYREYLNSYQGLNLSPNEIDRMILGNYAKLDEVHLRPLSKLYQDIGKELGLIK